MIRRVLGTEMFVADRLICAEWRSLKGDDVIVLQKKIDYCTSCFCEEVTGIVHFQKLQEDGVSERRLERVKFWRLITIFSNAQWRSGSSDSWFVKVSLKPEV